MKQPTSFYKNLKHTLFGTPLSNAQSAHEKLSKKRALAVFSSDALSSVAYASEEILRVLILAGSAFLGLSLPISLAIVGLLTVVVISYLQTIREYPSGGGAYIVARENLGSGAGQIAGAALLIDYVLTVAVSVSAGIEAVTSAFPSMISYRIFLCMAAVGGLTWSNLRGLQESAKIFAIPTYAFIFSILCMLAVGAYQLLTGEYAHQAPPVVAVQHPLTLLLLLRAFSSGCTALTGVEAVSNGIPAFQAPESKNASTTLVVMTFVLVTMFLGITFFAHYHGIVPSHSETVLSQIARSIFGSGPMYYALQFTTMSILILAANTSYAGFPRLASILAKDRYLPRQLASLGDRLVFSNGILLLGVFSAVLIILFNGSTHALIPLYAVGVFLSFTLSQGGMFRRWLNDRDRSGWFFYALLSLFGALITGVVMLIFIVTKFLDGAWMIVLLLPALMFVFGRVNRHYISVSRQLSLIGADPELHEGSVKHTVLIPISGIHKGVLDALKYARSIAPDVRAVYVEIDSGASARFQDEWQKWGAGVPLVVLKSPYRSVITPFLEYVDEVEAEQHDDIVTIVIPEFVTARWWESLLHNQTALLIRTALLFKRGKVVTSVRYHLN